MKREKANTKEYIEIHTGQKLHILQAGDKINKFFILIFSFHIAKDLRTRFLKYNRF